MQASKTLRVALMRSANAAASAADHAQLSTAKFTLGHASLQSQSECLHRKYPA
jgi:hypothetical protein